MKVQNTWEIKKIREQNLFGGAGPGGAFQAHQLAFAHMREHGFYRIDDEAQIRLAILVQGTLFSRYLFLLVILA